MGRSRDLRRQIRQERLQIARRRSVRELVTQAAAIISVFAAYGFIAYQTIYGVLTLGGLVLYFQAFQRAQSSLQAILNSVAGLYEDSLFVGNVYEFLDLKPRLVAPIQPKPMPRPVRTGIVFDHVSFQYPKSSRKALDDVSLTLRPGEVVALVGENGSGKTTLVKLLCRLYDPTRGRITVDGIDLRELDTTALRQEISVTFQDYVHYYLTARENIWLGNLSLPPFDPRIVAAARLSGADDVIAGLKNGYETVLGKWLDEGEELSIGQWQKVALARAFFREAQLMILDEPTSALDPMAEAEVFEKFRELIGGRSAILISHRLSTVRMADRIYVIERGRIVESGRHEELVHRGSRYANLFETQARNYQ
jgi:ATP-binding cassette, subfamily B, bacterial